VRSRDVSPARGEHSTRSWRTSASARSKGRRTRRGAESATDLGRCGRVTRRTSRHPRLARSCTTDLLGTRAVIVALHVATGAAAGAASGSRLAALLLGPVLHLVGDRLPHQDIRSRGFEIGSGLAGLLLLAARRGPLDPSTLGAAASSAPDLEHVLRSWARAGGSSSTAAAGTARGASRQTCSCSWPLRFSARSPRLEVEQVERERPRFGIGNERRVSPFRTRRTNWDSRGNGSFPRERRSA
jgi:hypothetical protein